MGVYNSAYASNDKTSLEDLTNLSDLLKTVNYLSLEKRVSDLELKADDAILERKVIDSELDIDVFSSFIVQTEEKYGKIKKNSVKDAKDERNLIVEDTIEVQNLIKRCSEILENMNDNDDLRIQIQYSTILIKKIDKMRAMEVIKTDSDKMKMLAFLRLLLKINSEESLFTEEQINLFDEAFSGVEQETASKEYIKK